MKKINLNGVEEILSEKELKNVLGGISKVTTPYWCKDTNPTCNNQGDCPGQLCYTCASDGKKYCA